NQAVYTPENKGHFGLALEHYAHFTSPIRRYPDLLVHRALKHIIAQKSVAKFIYSEEDMLGLGEQCSSTERRADEATRDVVDWLKCEFMLDKVGEEFKGIVTGVTSFGLFVELEEFYVEGLIHVTSLKNDYYRFDPVKHSLNGERSRQSYRLGDSLVARVVRVNLDDKKIDFDLVGGEGDNTLVDSKPKKGKSRHKAGTQKRPKKKEGQATAKKQKKTSPKKKPTTKKTSALKKKTKKTQKKSSEAASVVKKKAKKKAKKKTTSVTKKTKAKT
ncbi:MAG: RNB domain-containing ribonuclease, partial [Thiohalomonadales bacterium]